MKPILFNTEMVKAILDGRKTVTRRICKDANDRTVPLQSFIDNEKRTYAVQGYSDIAHEQPDCLAEVKMPICVGDILYVREAWQEVYETEYMDLEKGREIKNIHDCITNFDNLYKIECGLSTNWSWGKIEPRMKYIVFKADNLIYTDKDYELRWRPSIHMPKEAARIFLRVKNVKVEKMNSMGIQDMQNEGVNMDGLVTTNGIINYRVINRYEELWDATIKKSELDKYSFASNPWVWVIEFERITKEEA